MSSPLSLRVLVCDPQKNSRHHLCKFLARNPLVEEITTARSTGNLMACLLAKKINILFIDPLSLDLTAASDLIFQVREKLPHVVICLFINPGEVRSRAEAFYDGERERFSHYFQLNKQMTGPKFDEAALLMVSHCTEALRKWSRRPGRIQLISPTHTMEHGPRPVRSLMAEPAAARQNAPRTAPALLQPMELLVSSMSGIKSVARFLSRI